MSIQLAAANPIVLSTSKMSPVGRAFSMRMVCRFILVALVLSMAFNDLASAASKKFIKGFILGALLAKQHYPVVVHEGYKGHKGY